MKKMFLACAAFAATANFAVAQPQSAVEIVSIADCTHLFWAPALGSHHNEWVCPKGVKFILERYWFSRSGIVKAKPSEGLCYFNSDKNYWICPPGFKKLPPETTMVAVPVK